MEFKEIKEILEGKTGNVKIRGWLHNKRSSGGIVFLIVRDGTGFIQCVARKENVGEKILEELDHLTLESTLEIEGEAKKDERSPFGYEIEIKSTKILFKAYPDFPIQKKKMGVEHLLNYRHLWIRSRKMRNILLVRAKVLEAAREWFKENGFLEVQPPIIVSAACEGGSTLFEVNYFGKKAYLSQSWQLYGEAFISSVGKCYTIAPSFRAEKSRTRRHLTEYWHLEAEMPFCDINELMKIEEELITHILHKVAEDCKDILKEFGRDEKYFLSIKPPFPRINYKEAIEILKKDGVKIEYGDDIGADEERVLTQHFSTPFFLTHFPKKIKAFYHKPDPKNPEVTLSVDMLAPEGYGEIIGSGERIKSYEELMKRIKEENLDFKDYEWYLDLRKWGACQHSGFGLGIERLVMWILKLKHIRDAIAFPRLINRVYP
ncbi:MAG: asparagine--tRNA ligase [Candidatus Aenigmatarchaeota archaeon]